MTWRLGSVGVTNVRFCKHADGSWFSCFRNKLRHINWWAVAAFLSDRYAQIIFLTRSALINCLSSRASFFVFAAKTWASKLRVSGEMSVASLSFFLSARLPTRNREKVIELFSTWFLDVYSWAVIRHFGRATREPACLKYFESKNSHNWQRP